MTLHDALAVIERAVAGLCAAVNASDCPRLGIVVEREHRASHELRRIVQEDHHAFNGAVRNSAEEFDSNIRHIAWSLA